MVPALATEATFAAVALQRIVALGGVVEEIDPILLAVCDQLCSKCVRLMFVFCLSGRGGVVDLDSGAFQLVSMLHLSCDE